MEWQMMLAKGHKNYDDADVRELQIFYWPCRAVSTIHSQILINHFPHLFNYASIRNIFVRSHKTRGGTNIKKPNFEHSEP